MKALLTSWGLQDMAYVADFVELGWRILLILLLAWLLWHAASRLIGLSRLRLLARRAAADDLKRIQTMTQVFRYAVGVLITIVTVMLVLGELGISIAPLLATAGVAGVALGFGVQSLVKDYFTGFALLIENQVRQGDVIETAGKAGMVEEVTLRYIRLRDYEGVVHFIPNSLVSTVSNKTMGFGYAVILVGVAYHADIDKALRIIGEQAAALRADPVFGPLIMDDVEIAGVEELGESAVTLKARLRTMPLEQWKVRRECLRRIKQAFDAQGIEIPFPHLTVYAGTAPGRASFPVAPSSKMPAGLETSA
jgi:small-conductance mechanosensitive channel